MSVEQTGVINLGSTTNFVLRNNIYFSAAQRVINHYESRSLLKFKNQIFPVIIDSPTVIIFEKVCSDLVMNLEPLDLRSNAFPLGYLGMWIHFV